MSETLCMYVMGTGITISKFRFMPGCLSFRTYEIINRSIPVCGTSNIKTFINILVHTQNKSHPI